MKTSAVRRIYHYNGFAPTTSFADAIEAGAPDLLIPGDQYAVVCLHQVYDWARQRGKSGQSVCTLIERSVGSSKSYAIVRARKAVMQLAEEESIRVPRTTVAANLSDLKRCADELLFPLVLKADGTSSGEGVRIVRTLEEAKRGFRALQSPPSALRVAKRALIDRDVRSVLPALLRQRRKINAQEFVDGQDATSLAACWKGKVLARLHFEVVKKQYKNGPASVMRRIDIPELDTAISRIACRLELSGFHGFDFLLEKQSRKPYLIEMNPRPTQVGHLTLGHTRDLPAALYAAFARTPIEEGPKVTDNDIIALFPQEWMRNPSSVFLRTAYHDIPWEEPELIREGTRQRRGWSSWCRASKSARLFLTDRHSGAE
ncbi:MAG TPA: ATP-grasp domain-containing protein [Candidatus Acidoferrales bacterium]|nr:ATP-grasp domain-containing protein [Candidatus Acidoferrales bacterium]